MPSSACVFACAALQGGQEQGTCKQVKCTQPVLKGRVLAACPDHAVTHDVTYDVTCWPTSSCPLLLETQKQLILPFSDFWGV